MVCTKCGAENQEGSLFCNHCGSSLMENPLNSHEVEEIQHHENLMDNEVENEIKEDEPIVRKRKIFNKRMILIILVLFLIIGTVIGYLLYKKQYHEKYAANFSKTINDIVTEEILSEGLCAIVSLTWYAAIFDWNDYTDFNTKLAELRRDWENDGTIKKREDAKTKIENEMNELKNPPKDYKEAYNLLLDLYSIYGQILSQAISPQGSLTTYNQDVDQKKSDFDKIYDKIKVLKPEIKTSNNNIISDGNGL